MNKKILVGIGIAIVVVAVGIVSMKAMLGDEATELPFEEQSEKALNLQEPGGDLANLVNQANLKNRKQKKTIHRKKLG